MPATPAAARTHSTSSTGPAVGIRGKASGWDGSASGASWRSSTSSCWAGASDAFSIVVGDTRSIRGRPLRHHPRRRHGAAPGRRALAGGRAGPPAQSRGTMTRRWAGSPAGYGVLQPRVGVSLPSAYRSIFAAIHSGHPGVDPYTTAVSDVYQDLYGEGSFTGKGVYDVEAFERATRGPLSREHAALARPDRGELRPRRAGDRRRGLRRLPEPLPHLHPAQASLDPRRLAAPPLARPAGCRGPTARSRTGSRCSPAGRSSTTSAAAPSRSPSSPFSCAGGPCCPVSPLRWTAARPGRHRRAVDRLAAARAAAAAARQVLAGLLRRGGTRLTRPAPASWPWRSSSFRTRPGSPPTPSCGRSGECCSAGAGCWSGGPRRRPSGASEPRSARPCGGPCGPRWRSRPSHASSRSSLAGSEPSAVAGCGCGAPAASWPGSLSPRSRTRSASRRAPRAPPVQRRAEAGDALCPAPLALLRPVRRRGDQLARARQLPVGPGAGGGDAHLAHQHRAPAPRDGQRLGSRLHARWTTWPGGWSWRSARWSGCGASAATSTTGTTSGTSACWSRPTSLPSTAATWRGTSSRCGRPASPSPMNRCWTSAPGGRWRRRSRWRWSGSSRRPEAAAAREHLRGALAILQGAQRQPPSAELFARVASPLRQAESALAASGLTGEGLDAAGEWIAGGLRIAEAHARWLAALPERPGATLRELAAESAEASRIMLRLEAIAERAYAYAMEMDFRFLLDPERKLFAIGFHQTTHSLDGSYYDLLASEARLASFLAVAKNDAPVEHWFQLGRGLTHAAGRAGDGLVERKHVRVPDAGARDAVVPLDLAGPDLRGRGAPAPELRRGAPGALGRERERVQHPRPPPDLPVPGVRGARPRAEAGPGTRAGGRALRLHARRAGGSGAGAGQSHPARAARRARALRLPRRDRLHPARPRPALLARQHLHGAPSRHEPGGAHQHSLHRAVAASLPRRSGGPLRRAAAARADSPPAGAAEAAGRPPRRGAARARSWSSRRCGAWIPPTRRSPTSRCSATSPTPSW